MQQIFKIIIIIISFALAGLVGFALLEKWGIINVGLLQIPCNMWCSMTFNINILEGVSSGFCGC